MAAWSRTDWDEECVTTYRHVPKCRPCLSDSTPRPQAVSANNSARIRISGDIMETSIHK